MTTLSKTLNIIYERALSHTEESFIENQSIRTKVKSVSTNLSNRACVRFLMSCLLAKIDKPDLDIRKPYTEIKDSDSYSGRTYDQDYINTLVHDKKLPCNTTTAFLTPAFRNINSVLTPDISLVGRPKELYETTIELINLVHNGEYSADLLLTEVIRDLLIYKMDKEQRIRSLKEELASTEGNLPLSSEDIVSLIEQHLKSPKSSRLPVLVVAAIYKTASEYLREKVLPIANHNAADKQTKNLGDLEITIIDDDKTVTSYEMKTRKVEKVDIDDALSKIRDSTKNIDNYIYITTDIIEEEVQEYCLQIYDQAGIEFVILDCISFLRHILHLFHRLRMNFLNEYQDMLLEEPDSAVNQPLKEAFLTLRQAAEIAKNQ